MNGYTFLVELKRSSVRLAESHADSRLVVGDWFEMAHTGTFFSPVYGRIDITREDLADMFQNWETETVGQGGELMVDYDHLSDDPAKPGDGKAAGWIKALELRADGDQLWCRADWTKPAAQMIARGEYRFISPFFVTDYLSKTSGESKGPCLRAAGLTNRPFLEGMAEIPAPAIAASDTVARAFGRDRRVSLAQNHLKFRSQNPGRKALQAAAGSRIRQQHPRSTHMAQRTIAAADAPTPPLPPVQMEGAEQEMGDAPEPGLTCPHCGAPVKHHAAHAAPAPHAEPGGDELGAAAEHDGDSAELADQPTLPKTGEATGPADARAEGRAADGDEDEPGPARTEESVDMGDPPPLVKKPVQMRESADQRRIRQLEEALSETQRTLRVQQKEQRRQMAEKVLARALREGKVTKSLVGTAEKPGWARSFAFRDPAGFQAWVASAPQLVEFGERGTSETAAADSAAGTQAEIDQLVAKKMSDRPNLVYADALKQVMSENVSLKERYESEFIGQRSTTARRL